MRLFFILADKTPSRAEATIGGEFLISEEEFCLMNEDLLISRYLKPMISMMRNQIEMKKAS